MYLLPGRGTWHCRYEDPEETPVPLQSTTLADICLAVFAVHESSLCAPYGPLPWTPISLSPPLKPGTSPAALALDDCSPSV